MFFCVRVVLSGTDDMFSQCSVKFHQLDSSTIIFLHSFVCVCVVVVFSSNVLLSPWLFYRPPMTCRSFTRPIFCCDPPISSLGWVCQSICKYLYTAVHQCQQLPSACSTLHTIEQSSLTDRRTPGEETVAHNEIKMLNGTLIQKGEIMCNHTSLRKGLNQVHHRPNLQRQSEKPD